MNESLLKAIGLKWKDMYYVWECYMKLVSNGTPKDEAVMMLRKNKTLDKKKEIFIIALGMDKASEAIDEYLKRQKQNESIEGMKSKGGLNNFPTTPRPSEPPKGKG